MSNTDNGPVPHAQDELPANVSDISVSRNAANGNAAASVDWSLYQFKGGITVGGFGVDEYQNSRNLAGINLALYLSKSRETKKKVWTMPRKGRSQMRQLPRILLLKLV